MLLFAASIFAVAARREAGRWRRGAALPFLAWAVTGAVPGAAALANRQPAPAPQPPDVLREFADDEYRSSGACRSCHPDQYATGYATYHRTMTQVASPASVIGDFDGNLRVRVEAEAPFECIDFVRSGEVSTAGLEGQVAWSSERTVPRLTAGEYLYVRAIRQNGGTVWSSPIYAE